MLLLTVATDFELHAFLMHREHLPPCDQLITGVGPVETAVRLSGYLAKFHEKIHAVINFGIGGAYIRPEKKENVNILDICLASSEVLGDFGICFESRIDSFSPEISSEKNSFPMDPDLLEQGSNILKQHQFPFHTGPFVTVNCVSATEKRKYLALCMRGFVKTWKELLLPEFVKSTDSPAWKYVAFQTWSKTGIQTIGH